MKQKPGMAPFQWYIYSGSYLSISLAVVLLLTATVIGIIGFMLIENYEFMEAFYMTAITISTVGFGEIRPLSYPGQLFVSIYILFNIGMYAYFLAAFTSYVIHGEFMKNIHNNMIDKEISKLKDHVIICGYGKYGGEISKQFIRHKLPFVIIERSSETIEEIQKSKEKILYIEDDATRDEVLIKAGIIKARALISALPNDSDNVFTTLTARQLNAQISIVSRSFDQKNIKKLKMAGANHVIMPEQIGGFYIATLINKPGAVAFFSFISNENVSDIHFEEIHHEVIAQKFNNCSLQTLAIRQKSGANVIALRKANNEFIINPPPDSKLQPGETYIVLGDERQLKKFRNAYLK